MPLLHGERLEEIVLAEDRGERSGDFGRFVQAHGRTGVNTEPVEHSRDVLAQVSMPSDAQNAWRHKPIYSSGSFPGTDPNRMATGIPPLTVRSEGASGSCEV